MKTNTMKDVIAAATAGTVALTAVVHVNANYLPFVALGVGYLAVVILLALAANDYRIGRKDYLGR